MARFVPLPAWDFCKLAASPASTRVFTATALRSFFRSARCHFASASSPIPAPPSCGTLGTANVVDESPRTTWRTNETGPTRLRSCSLASLRPTRVRSAHGSTPDSAFADRATAQGGGGLGIQMRAAPARPAHPHVSTYPSSRHRASIRADSVGTAGDRAVRRRRSERRGADAARVAGGEARAPARAVRVVSRHELERLQDMQGPRQNRAQTPRRSPKSGLSYCKTCAGPRAVSVRRVRGHGRGEQLAVRPDREPGVGAEGTVAQPGPTAAADAREVTPRRARGSAARAVL